MLWVVSGDPHHRIGVCVPLQATFVGGQAEAGEPYVLVSMV